MGRIARSKSFTVPPSPAILLLACVAALIATGCGGVQGFTARPPSPITSIVASPPGAPNSVIAFGSYAFVTVQNPGFIVSFVQTGTTQTSAAGYSTPCAAPSGMVTATAGIYNVLAVVCFDTGSLITYSIAADGTLHGLGMLTGLGTPYPGIAIDGTNVFVPIFGSGTTNGSVAEIGLANPAAPKLLGAVTLASPAPGENVNAVALAASGGYVYVAAGSESLPLDSSSSIQVVKESTMTLVGAPFIVPHSPQQIAIAGATAYVTLYDAAELEAIDISNPAALKSVATASLANCNPVPVAVAQNTAYIGCYPQGTIARLNVANQTQMQAMTELSGIPSPQDIVASGNVLLVTSAASGGALYTIDLSAL